MACVDRLTEEQAEVVTEAVTDLALEVLQAARKEEKDTVHYFILLCWKCDTPLSNNRVEEGVVVLGCPDCGIEVGQQGCVMGKDEFIRIHGKGDDA